MILPKFITDYETLKDEFYIFYRTVRQAFRDGISPDVIIPHHSCHISDMIKYYNISVFYIDNLITIHELGIIYDIGIMQRTVSESYIILDLLKKYQMTYSKKQNLTKRNIIKVINKIHIPDDCTRVEPYYNTDDEYESNNDTYIQDFLNHIYEYYNKFIRGNDEFNNFILNTDIDNIDNEYKLTYHSIIQNGKKNNEEYKNSISDDLTFERDFMLLTENF